MVRHNHQGRFEPLSQIGGKVIEELITLIILAAVISAPAQTRPQPVLQQPLLYNVPFKAGEGYARYRIPALFVTAKRTLLAFCEGRHKAGQLTGDIDIVLRRSFDNGQTWEAQQIVADIGADTCGNPCIVQDAAAGTLWLGFTKSRGEDHEADIVAGTQPGTTVWMTQSADDGVTWAAPVEISATARKAGWGWYGTGPGIGLSLRSGRLIMPSYHTEGGVYRSHMLYSDDHGTTWQIGADVADHTSECQIIEADPRTLLVNARTIDGPQRTQRISTDRGLTWREDAALAALPENNCEGCLYACFRNGSSGQFDWLFAHPLRTSRAEAHVWISDDHGKSWPHAQRIWSGPSAYTSMMRMPQGGQVGVLLECGTKTIYDQIAFVKFSPEWLKAGQAPESASPPVAAPKQ